MNKPLFDLSRPYEPFNFFTFDDVEKTTSTQTTSTSEKEKEKETPSTPINKPTQKSSKETRLISRNDVVTGNLRRNIEQRLPKIRYRKEPAEEQIQSGLEALRIGDSGPQVKRMQQTLNTSGAQPRLKEDGLYGPLTQQAVREYQRKQAITADGVAGKETLGAMKLRTDAQKPTEQKPTEQKPTEPSSTLTKDQFLTELSNKRMSAAQKISGISDVAVADLDSNGVISTRQEWAELFRQVDRRDRNGDASSVDTDNPKVKETLDALRSAPSDAKPAKPAYSNVELRIMNQALAGGPQPDDAKPYSGSPPTDYLGRKISEKAVQVRMNWAVKEANLVYDPDAKRFYKQLDDGSPLVPLTAQELKSAQVGIKASHPNDMEQPNDAYKRIYVGFFPKEIERIDFESPL